jgi:hypothetical protein
MAPDPRSWSLLGEIFSGILIPEGGVPAKENAKLKRLVAAVPRWAGIGGRTAVPWVTAAAILSSAALATASSSCNLKLVERFATTLVGLPILLPLQFGD